MRAPPHRKPRVKLPLHRDFDALLAISHTNLKIHWSRLPGRHRAFERRMGWPLTPWGGWQNYVGDGLSDPDSDYRSDYGRWIL